MTIFDYLVPPSLTVGEGMKRLESCEYKDLFVADGDRHLLGVVTDGDIRRFLMAGGSLGERLDAVMKREPLAVEGYSERRARELLHQNGVTCVPITVDGLVEALVFEREVANRVDNLAAPVVIMAGGFGTRLLPYTEILPKPLIPVGGKTMTEQVIDRFSRFGCRDFTLIVNYKKNLIKSYFSETDAGVDLRFVDEEQPLGTGGGLCYLKGQLSEPFFLTNCDNIIEADYAELLRRHVEGNRAVTMVCAAQRLTVPYGVVVCEGDQFLEVREKPGFDYLINTGFYILSPAFLEQVEDGKFQPMTDIITRCRTEGLTIGVERVADDAFLDIGKLEDIKEAERRLSYQG